MPPPPPVDSWVWYYVTSHARVRAQVVAITFWDLVDLRVGDDLVRGVRRVLAQHVSDPVIDVDNAGRFDVD